MPVTSINSLVSRGTNSNGSNNSNLSNGAIIVLVLVGAGLLVLIGYAIGRFWLRADHSQPVIDNGFSQAQYMREVRLRNQEVIESNAGVPRGYPRGGGGGGGGYGGYDSGVTSPRYGNGGYGASTGQLPVYDDGGNGSGGEGKGKWRPHVNERRVTDEGDTRMSNASSMY